MAPTTPATQPAGSPPLSSSAAVIPYTYGLTGVNIPTNNASSDSLYVLIGVVCLLVVAVRLGQLGSSHLRTITSFTATPEQQRYWTENPSQWWPWLKRNLIWAPLRHKRHHREIQLSKAINMGIIPGRLHVLLLSLLAISQVVYLLLLDFQDPQAELIAELRGRSGHLATLNMIILYLFAGRNNPLIRLLRVSFDTFNLFHRWIGRIVIVEALIHTFAWGANKYLADGLTGIDEALLNDPFLQYGLLAIVSMVVILIQTPSAIRHAFYEIFLHLHQFLAFLALLGVSTHVRLGNLPQLPFVILIIAIWCYDRLVRWARIIYYNVSWKHGLSRVTIEAMPGETCRVTFHMPRAWTPPPGAHVYAYLPTVSWWQSHPFSIAWSSATSYAVEEAGKEGKEGKEAAVAPGSPASSIEKGLGPSSSLPGGIALRNGTSVSLVMSARSGMTRKLYKRAWAQPRHQLQCTGFLEGPYGSLESLASYGTVVLFAGGIGITHNLPLLRDLLERYERGTSATRQITLVWSVRTVDALEWVRPFMDELLRMPGRRAALTIKIFVTRPLDQRAVVSASDRVQMCAGRANPTVLVRHAFDNRIGAMCVGVCGPGVFADEVRAAARSVVEEGKVDFWEEGFTW